MSYLGTLILYYTNHPVPIVSNNAAAHVTSLPASVDTGTIVMNKDNAHFFYHNRKK
jgi:hypothetical protein